MGVPFLDLKQQHQSIQNEVDTTVQRVTYSSRFSWAKMSDPLNKNLLASVGQSAPSEWRIGPMSCDWVCSPVESERGTK